MKKVALIVLLVPYALLFAQETKNPVSSVVKEILPRQQKNLVAAAEEMPADKYDFKPTPQQMSFAHLVIHVAESNNHLCAKISDSAEPKTGELKETDGKDKLVAALKASFDFCDTALAKVDDSKLGDTVELFGGRKGPRAAAMFFLTNGWADHYSAAAMYLRLNGLLPPTAQKK
ncbi:MAG TPA: DinB family protein [Terriglobales bacterium]|nr:DinB family protein [Terriglobales bacterium]